MKTRMIGSVIRQPEGTYAMRLSVIRKGSDDRVVDLRLEPEAYDPDASDPVPFTDQTTADGLWLFRGRVISVEDANTLPREEVVLRIKHAVVREERAYSRIKRDLEAFENMERLPTARREHIPDSVRLFVWQRDEGKCVRCRSREKLEFDHIIPVAKGGGNSERNIQLLCERCNRSKRADI